MQTPCRMLNEYDPDLTAESMHLLELALRLRWSSAAERAKRYPQEIEEQDEDGLTVLHWACCNQPPVRFLRELHTQEEPFRRAACIKDANGMTPLLCACACRASPEAISFLIESCPASVMYHDYEKWTALHYLASSPINGDRALEKFHSLTQQLLSVDSSLGVAEDSGKRTPLQMLCDAYQLELQTFYYSVDPVLEGEMQVLWDIIQTMMKSQESSHPNSSILHRLVSLSRCPMNLVMIVSRIYPDLLIHQDGTGNTPLHLAILASSSSSSMSGFLPIFLFRKDSDAASLRNDKGEFPFCIARRIHGKWSTLHGLLLRAYPQAIEMLDLAHNLYPAILGHTSDCETTMFEIFRANPTLFASRDEFFS